MSEKRSIPQNREEPSSLPENVTEEDVSPDQDEPLQEAPAEPGEPVSLPERLDSKETSPKGGKASSSSFLQQSESKDTSCLESPMSISPFVSQCNSPAEGAFGGQELEQSTSSGSAAREVNRQVFSLNRGTLQCRQTLELDRRAHNSGKLDVFRRFFNEDKLDFFVRPENRQRHNAERRRRSSESDGPSPDSNPLRHLQNIDPPPEPLLNQAGAVIGIKSSSSFGLLGSNNPVSGYEAETEHSLGSMETAPIAEVYSGNFEPLRPSSELSDRGVSPGQSFPSFSSRPQTSSDCYNPRMSPPPESEASDGARGISSMSTDSERLPEERSVRQRKSSVSRQMESMSESALAGSEGSSVEEQSDRISSRILEARTGAVRKISKDSSDSTGQTCSSSKESNAQLAQRVATDSEDEAVLYPELSHSVESAGCEELPIPDITAGTLEVCQQNSGDMQASAALTGPQTLDDLNTSPETLTEESEQDPVSVLSCSPETPKNMDTESLKRPRRM